MIALSVLGGVFWLKLEHAHGVCADAGGRWRDGDCVFAERDGADGALSWPALAPAFRDRAASSP